ncbi:MAG: tetratricopeptide repeat protein [Crocinitomicaceae bacterium]|nr:tetratricopeptide repeat protein [Crocinitomicaceae bacterium]
MKSLIKSIGLAVGILALTSTAFGQKKNETSAAVEYKNNFQSSMAKQDMEGAMKSLLEAKKFIDLAAAHEDTKGSQKTLMYKGQIYSSIAILLSMDSTFTDISAEDALAISLEAFKTGHGLGKKYKGDIEAAVNQNYMLLSMAAGMSYEAEEFGDAAEAYDYASQFSAAIGIMDSSSIFNASLCYDRDGNYERAAEGYARLVSAGYRESNTAVMASNAYRKIGKTDEAKNIIEAARKNNPTDRGLLLELVNLNIDAGNAEGAEIALNDAIKTDPENKLLHFTIGTIYNELGKNESAEAALNKALQIDPDYVDAQYQLGAILVAWAGDISTKAKQLEFGDPSYNTMIAESEATYRRALAPLEKYIAAFPEDKTVLNILFQIERNLGNSEKALEYKKRHDALPDPE